MNWDQMRRQYYKTDGNFRDIFVPEMDELCWQNFFECLEQSGATLTFQARESDGDSDHAVEFSTLRRDIVELQWQLREFVPFVRVTLQQKVTVTFYFFAKEELEGSFDPRCIKNEAAHKVLFGFLCKLANAMERTVNVSHEDREKMLYPVKPRPQKQPEMPENTLVTDFGEDGQ